MHRATNAARPLALPALPAPFPNHPSPISRSPDSPAEFRGWRSYQNFLREREESRGSAGPHISMERWLVEQNRLVPPPAPLLSVDNFNLENLEVRRALPPQAPLLFAFAFVRACAPR